MTLSMQDFIVLAVIISVAITIGIMVYGKKD